MHNYEKYLDQCLWYENFCNVIVKYNGISVSTYADISKKKNVKTYILNMFHKSNFKSSTSSCLRYIYKLEF